MNQTAKQPNKPQALQPITFTWILQVLSLRIGEQVFVCSSTLVSALVPTLVLINVTEQKNHEPNSQTAKQASSTSTNQFWMDFASLVTQNWRASVCVLIDTCLSSGANTCPHQCDRTKESWAKQPNSQTSLKHFNQSLLHGFCKSCHSELETSVCVLIDTCLSSGANTCPHQCDRTKKNEPNSQTAKQPNSQTSLKHFNQSVWIGFCKSCHSELESKCLCAHRHLSQLWCQHLSSSMWQNKRIMSQTAEQPNKPQALQPISFDGFCKSCHSELESKCLCAHRHLSQLWCQHLSSSMWLNKIIMSQTAEQPNKPQALQPISFEWILQVLSLRIGEQVFVCSSTLVSALVPTLVLINVTEQKNHEPNSQTSLKHFNESLLHGFFKSCHSELESKCLCAHRHLSQLWCQHLSSSMWQNKRIMNQTAKQPNKPQALQPISFEWILQVLSLRIGEQVFVCSSTLVSALVPTLVLINVTEQKNHEPNSQTAKQASSTSTNQFWMDFASLVTQNWRASVCVLIDTCLSSGANTCPHQCDWTKESWTKQPNSQTSLKHFNQSVWIGFCKSCHSELESKCLCAHRHLSQLWCQHLSSSMWLNKRIMNQTAKQPNKPQALQPISFEWILQVLSLRIGEQVFVCSSTLVSALVPTLVLINVTEQKNHEPNSQTSLKHFNQSVLNGFYKFCHSELESKCLYAHWHLSQLWCQHLSSSMLQNKRTKLWGQTTVRFFSRSCNHFNLSLLPPLLTEFYPAHSRQCAVRQCRQNCCWLCICDPCLNFLHSSQYINERESMLKVETVLM